MRRRIIFVDSLQVRGALRMAFAMPNVLIIVITKASYEGFAQQPSSKKPLNGCVSFFLRNFPNFPGRVFYCGHEKGNHIVSLAILDEYEIWIANRFLIKCDAIINCSKQYPRATTMNLETLSFQFAHTQRECDFINAATETQIKCLLLLFFPGSLTHFVIWNGFSHFEFNNWLYKDGCSKDYLLRAARLTLLVLCHPI